MGVSTNDPQLMASRFTYASALVSYRLRLILANCQGTFQDRYLNNGLQYGPSMNLLVVDESVDVGCNNYLAQYIHLKVNGNFTPRANVTLVGLFSYIWVFKLVKNMTIPFPINEFKLEFPLQKYPH